MIAPFPWFGGKRRVADVVWQRFGDVPNYVEPFFGSGAVLLGRPHEAGVETVNDKDGFVANFWRAIQADPEAVARHADWPVSENDLHARHSWLVAQRASFLPRIEGDPSFYDAKIAGWWVWGLACWIGSGFCSGNGPWHVVDGQLVHLGDAGQGVHRKLVHLGDAGRGVNRQLVHLGDAGQGVHRKLVHLGDAGRGVNRQLVHLGDAGRGEAGEGGQGLLAWFWALSERLSTVRVASGDWSRVCGPSVTVKIGVTGVFLDPPYGVESDRTAVYRDDDLSIASDVRRWCAEWGGNPQMRIALCGYQGEHDDLQALGWTPHFWKARGGYGSQGDGRGRENAAREVIWFSPHCLQPARYEIGSLFDEEAMV